MVADYSNQSPLESGADLRSKPFIVPELCNVTAISLLVLFGELLVLVMMFAGGPLTWIRLALVSLFVQWVALTSAGVLCTTRKLLARLGLVRGAVLAFGFVMVITLTVGVISHRLLSQNYSIIGVDWTAIIGQLVISGIITVLALRYFHVQQQLRMQEQRKQSPAGCPVGGTAATALAHFGADQARY